MTHKKYIMKNLLSYNNFYTRVEFDAEDDILHGKILFINDTYIFHGHSIDEFKQMFHESVDMYIQDCKDEGKDPQKTFKGSFNIRISPELHRKMAIDAGDQGISQSKYIEKAIEFYQSQA